MGRARRKRSRTTSSHEDLPKSEKVPTTAAADSTAASQSKKRFRRLKETRRLSSPASSVSSSSTIQLTTALMPLPFPSDVSRPSNQELMLNEPPYQKSFQTALKTSYEGFVVDPSISLKEITVQSCLHDMYTQKYFRRDVTQPFGLGTKCAKTYVTRCLVGDPGTTYKYLGLRMFAHPWKLDESKKSSLSSSSLQQSNRTLKTTRVIRELGDLLTKRTKLHLQQLDQKRQQRGAPLTRGRATFDICLINRMDPTEQLKGEPNNYTIHSQPLGTSVSWHADSSLEHYSTIAVYQTLSDIAPISKTKTTESNEWYIALRVTPHCEGPTVTQRSGINIASIVDPSIPPIAVSLPSGSAYYLLDDFNHHHQHTVLKTSNNNDAKKNSGSIRYSCTFRCLRQSHHIGYVLQRCHSTVSQFHKKGGKLWRSEQLLLHEIESEWIRQFFIQGSQHYDLLWHAYWKGPIVQLLDYWKRLEERTHQICQLLIHAAHGRCSDCTYHIENDDNQHKKEMRSSQQRRPHRKIWEKRKKAVATIQSLSERQSSEDGTDESYSSTLYTLMADALDSRATMREQWSKREKDHVFTELPFPLRPMRVPFGFRDGTYSNETKTKKEEHGYQYDNNIIVLSPLPGNPNQLRELANAVRKFGTAFGSGNAKDLPEYSFERRFSSDEATSVTTTKAVSDTDATSHSKSLTWSGWSQPNLMFGLELQEPCAMSIVNGSKTVETRAYELPPALMGKHIWILQSPVGKAGVSAMDDVVDLAQQQQQSSGSSCKIVGWCRFGSMIRYTKKSEFEADESRHLVDSKSGYGWRCGVTRVIYGWVVAETSNESDKVTNDSTQHFTTAIRRMRSLFELKQASSTNTNKRHKPSLEKQKLDKRPKKKKRKRF